MTLINYTEKIVRERLNEYAEQHRDEFCTCRRCMEDIMALALNRLPPHYVVTHIGEVMTDFKLTETLDRTKVLTELVRAIHKVTQYPSHAINEPSAPNE